MTIQIPLNQCARPSGSPNSERMHFGFEFFLPFAPETMKRMSGIGKEEK
jgi:hypothetical protein